MKSRKSQLMLIEILISILFFALCSSICVQAFAKSYTISRQNNQQMQMLTKTETAQAVLMHSQFPQAADILGGELVDSKIVIHFDSQWQKASEGKFAMEIEQSGDTNLITFYEISDNEKIQLMQQEIILHTPITVEVAHG